MMRRAPGPIDTTAMFSPDTRGASPAQPARLRRFACAGLLACASASVVALAAPPPAAEREIAALIAELGRSGCRFERNGRWYDAATARAHLQKKYDYLRKRDLVDSAEQFIERGASESSMSGKPYRVQCAPQPATTAAAWFKQRLAAIRTAAEGPAQKPAAKPASSNPASPAARKS